MGLHWHLIKQAHCFWSKWEKMLNQTEPWTRMSALFCVLRRCPHVLSSGALNMKGALGVSNRGPAARKRWARLFYKDRLGLWGWECGWRTKVAVLCATRTLLHLPSNNCRLSPVESLHIAVSLLERAVTADRKRGAALANTPSMWGKVGHLPWNLVMSAFYCLIFPSQVILIGWSAHSPCSWRLKVSKAQRWRTLARLTRGKGSTAASRVWAPETLSDPCLDLTSHYPVAPFLTEADPINSICAFVLA